MGCSITLLHDMDAGHWEAFVVLLALLSVRSVFSSRLLDVHGMHLRYQCQLDGQRTDFGSVAPWGVLLGSLRLAAYYLGVLSSSLLVAKKSRFA